MNRESNHDTTQNNHNDYEGNNPYVVDLLELLNQHPRDVQTFKEALEKAQAQLERLQDLKKEAEQLSRKARRLLKRSRNLALPFGNHNYDD